MTAEDRFLRHVVATLAYRGAKVLRDAPPALAEQRVAPGSRSALEILSHVGDVLQWGASLARGEEAWRPQSEPAWEAQVERYFVTLAELDAAAADGVRCSPQRLFQGPLADAMTHLGQLAMLRRLAGAPIGGEDFSRAAITEGRVGPDQAPARRPFEAPAEKLPTRRN